LIDKAEHSGGTATCKAKAVCSTCNVEYGTVNSNNHVGETEIRGAEPATCDKDGYTGDTWCKDCNTKIKDGEPIPAGHKTTEVPANPATHEAAGNIKYYTCSGCSLLFADAEAKTEIKAEDTVVAKGEHSYGEWVNTDAENHWKECACGNKIETAAHKDANIDGKCDVCGYNVGVSTDSNSPQTGDNSNLLLWFVLLMVSALGIFSTVVFNKKRAR
jgi:LPXTG-motif cell wall-anchored protein